jgi:nitroreductase
MLADLVQENRSYRRFFENDRIGAEELKSLIDLARKSASARNLQPLSYIIVCSPEVNERVFPHLAWAGYLPDWQGPERGERPAAYIIVLHDTEIKTTEPLLWCDLGLACQNILLGAVEKGFGGCLIGSFNRQKVVQSLGIPSQYVPLIVIALGRPKEKVMLEEIKKGGDIRYYRDETGVHHVPKRRLEDVVLSLPHSTG